MFKEFVKKYPETTVTYPLFKYVISQYNKKISQEILNGKEFYPGYRLGRIKIKKVERTCFTKPVPNWGETKKLKAQGIDKIVFFTDNYYFRWFWEKSLCNIPNKIVYKFSPSAGSKGNRIALVNLLKTNEFAHLNYTT